MEQQQQPIMTKGDHVLSTPFWVVIIRAFQFLVSLIILGLTARLMHDAYIDIYGFVVAMVIITWIVLAYIVLSEKVPSLRSLYNVIAVLILDGLLVVLWLACWAATAAERAKYRWSVSVSGCYDDGSAFDSKTCFRKRDAIFFKSGLSMFSSIAGLGALVWILFIVTFAWSMVTFFRLRKEGRFAFGSGATAAAAGGDNTYQMEPKIEAQPVAVPQQQQYQQQPVQGQFPPQGQQQYQQPQSPYQQQPAYSPPVQTAYPTQEQQYQGQYPPQQQQQPIQPQMTGQSAVPISPYGSELTGSENHQYQQQQQQQQQYPPVATSPPPQELHNQQYPPTTMSPPPQELYNHQQPHYPQN